MTKECSQRLSDAMGILPISVCMLVRDEEQNLQKSLPPLTGFAEILVLDSGSKDRSVELCEKAGATVFKESWEGFGKTRKKLFKKATQPWILWLDADEVVTPELLASMRELLSREPACAAYKINRMVFFQGRWIRHGEWFPDWTVRLFRSNCWDMQERAIHETLMIEGRVGKLEGVLEHYSFKDIEDVYRREASYARLWAQEHSGRSVSLPVIGLRACWSFVRALVLKKGFMDGWIGVQVAWFNARGVAKKYACLRAYHKNSKCAETSS